MQQIQKFQLFETNLSERLLLPADSFVLSSKVQKGSVCVWIAVGELKAKREFVFEARLTGQITDISRYTFLDTALLEDGDFIIHVFYKVEDAIA